MNAARIARLETALAVLEKAAGLSAPEYEVVREGQAPCTDADLVVELRRFKNETLEITQKEQARLEAEVRQERTVFDYQTRDVATQVRRER